MGSRPSLLTDYNSSAVKTAGDWNGPRTITGTNLTYDRTLRTMEAMAWFASNGANGDASHRR